MTTMSTEAVPSRDEMEKQFRHYFMTGPVHEDWVAWSQLFTEDATYTDHMWGVFHGPSEIAQFLDGTMSFASHVYSALIWYNIDGNRIVYKVVNRADNPEPGGTPIEFPSLQVIEYAGDGKWASEDDWWTIAEMKEFNLRWQAAVAKFGAPGEDNLSRKNWGSWVDWARPEPGDVPKPSWFGRSDVPRISSMREMTFGTRHDRPFSGRKAK
jgi:hypothetical protein